MAELARDIRLALKALLRERAFSATVLTTLAVVVGANVAIFSVIHTVLLEPLPYEEPTELVTLYNSYPGAGVERASNGSYDFFMRRERVQAFEEVALSQGSGAVVGDPGATESVATLRATPSFFPLLGVQAALGRTFTDDEMEPGNDHKVLLMHAFWQDHFGGAADVLTRELRVDGRPHTIVGVLPADFEIVGGDDTRLVVPIAFDERERSPDSWHSNNFSMLARLRDGATVEQARAQVEALNQALIDEWPIPNGRQLLEDAGFTTVVRPAQEDLVADIRPTLYMLWAGVGFVLLIGCVNIANLMLARSQVRMGEVATRLALGAPRSRVARQVVTEALVMSVIGGAAGVGVGLLGLRLLMGTGLERLPRGTSVGVDGTVLAFTLVLAFGAGLVFAAIPVLDVMGRDLSAVFRAEGRSGTASRGAVVLRSSLVAGQVGLAFVLLIGAGLMLMSFRAALAVDPGFHSQGVFTALTSLPSARYPDADERRAYTDELLREVEALPGVSAASLTSMLPFSGNNSSSVILPEGYELRPGESLLSPYQSWVGPGYFRTMGIEVVEGREFEWSDDAGQPNAIVLDRWLARRYWPDASPLGRRMVWGEVPGADSVPEESVFTIVGVVETIKQNDLTAPDGAHVGAYYFAHRQNPQSFFGVVARARDGVGAASLAPAARDIANRLDPEVPLFSVQTMDERIDRSLANRRTPMTLLGVFAGVALFLAVVGIYGALSYSVTRRTREMGIRMAMGSAAGDVFRLVLAHGLRVTAFGLVLGVVGSLALAGTLRSFLFGVRPLDPAVMAVVATVLGAAAVVACAVPAWRATRVDPISALTTE
jgi:predicted permease